jgi:hypothetical protein
VTATAEFKVPESNRWADFVWPEWVPERERRLIEDFWREAWGRGPREWAEANAQPCNDAPPSGSRARMWNGFARHVASGRYVYRWGNLGSIVRDDGSIVCAVSGIADDASIARARASLQARVEKLLDEYMAMRSAIVRLEEEIAHAG